MITMSLETVDDVMALDVDVRLQILRLGNFDNSPVLFFTFAKAYFDVLFEI